MKTVIYFKTIENSPARRKMAGFLDYARLQGWNIQIVLANPGDLHAILDFWKPDGCVVNAASGNNNFNGAALEGVPSVFIDRPPVSLRPSDSYIYHDSAQSVRLALRELLRTNPRSCAYASWPVPHPWDAERRKEYERIVRINGLEPCVFEPRCGVEDAARIQTEIAGFLASLPRPAAVLAAADPLGVQVVSACRLARLSVPDEVAVVGIDNDEELCETACPALSSVAPDHFHAGRRAAEILEKLMEKRQHRPVRETYASPTLTRRGSSLHILRRDSQALAAMEKIRASVCGNIAVKSILGQFNCSRRNAEYRFRAATGMSPAEALRKARYERARELLKREDMKISTVANLCGYSSPAAFSRFFKAMSGASPRSART